MTRLSRTGWLFTTLVPIITMVVASCVPPSQDDEAASVVRHAVMPTQPDCLYIGDDAPGTGADDQIERFDPFTGTSFGQLNDPGALISVRGMVFGQRGGRNAQLIVGDANVGVVPDLGGEVLLFERDGGLAGSLVGLGTPNAPYVPRGMVLGKQHTLYVADQGDDFDPVMPGRVIMFDARTGEWLGDLEPTGYDEPYHPRGVVIGPDGLLYVSVIHTTSFTGGPLGLGGDILRFDPATGEYLGVFIESDTCGCEGTCPCDLNRPEGLVFGPDGNLYVTSFRNASDPTSVDRIFVFDGQTGELLNTIDLWQPGGTRVFAQALLFGPGGELYVPLTNTGEVRVYDVTDETYRVLVPAGTVLRQPVYLTFCGTDPATLAYEPRPYCACGP